MAKGDKEDLARAKTAVSKKKVRGGQAQAFPRPRGGVQQGSKDAWSRPGRTYRIYDDDTNKQTQTRSSQTTSTGKPRDDSKALARAKAIRSGMSKVEIRNQIMAEQRAKSQKALVKLNGNKTPKQLKDDRVKATRQKSALAKMKANPKVNLSPTSSALERAKAKKGK